MGRTGLPAQAHGAKATSSLTGATMALGPPRLRLLGRLSEWQRLWSRLTRQHEARGVPSAAAGRRARGLLTATCGVRSLPWGEAALRSAGLSSLFSNRGRFWRRSGCAASSPSSATCCPGGGWGGSRGSGWRTPRWPGCRCGCTGPARHLPARGRPPSSSTAAAGCTAAPVRRAAMSSAPQLRAAVVILWRRCGG